MRSFLRLKVLALTAGAGAAAEGVAEEEAGTLGGVAPPSEDVTSTDDIISRRDSMSFAGLRHFQFHTYVISIFITYVISSFNTYVISGFTPSMLFYHLQCYRNTFIVCT